MTETLPTIVVPYFVGFTGVLVGIVWNNLNDKIKNLSENEKACPIHTVKTDLATMKNDIAWIKREMEKKQQ